MALAATQKKVASRDVMQQDEDTVISASSTLVDRQLSKSKKTRMTKARPQSTSEEDSFMPYGCFLITLLGHNIHGPIAL